MTYSQVIHMQWTTLKRALSPANIGNFARLRPEQLSIHSHRNSHHPGLTIGFWPIPRGRFSFSKRWSLPLPHTPLLLSFCAKRPLKISVQFHQFLGRFNYTPTFLPLNIEPSLKLEN
jgi:hypothetical protein